MYINVHLDLHAMLKDGWYKIIKRGLDRMGVVMKPSLNILYGDGFSPLETVHVFTSSLYF